MLEDITKTLPFWILGVGGVLVLILEVFNKKDWPRAGVSSLLSLIAILTAIFNSFYYLPGESAFNRQVYTDPIFLFTTIFFCLALTAVLFISYQRINYEQIESQGEYYGLILMCTAGALLFANAQDFICLFIGLEILSMAIYCLCGSAIYRRSSIESALKYFLLGSFGSAIFLYGIALLYGLTGSLVISDIAQVIDQNPSVLTMLSLGLIIFGFAFKLGLVPAHFWVPDVYQGAPTTITAYMSTVVKASALIAFLRVLWGVYPNFIESWSKLIAVLAILTIVVGNLIALRQRNVKRMLAYSSVAHAGYMSLALLVPQYNLFGGPAILFYLISYSIVSMGAFAILASLNDDECDTFDISSFYGLSVKSPFLAFAFSLFLLGLAGLPPGMAGFLGKFYVFSSTISAGYIGLSVVAILASVVSVYYYLRVIVAMYFMGAGNSESKFVKPSQLHQGVIIICLILSILIGLFPNTLFNIAYLAMLNLSF